MLFEPRWPLIVLVLLLEVVVLGQIVGLTVELTHRKVLLVLRSEVFVGSSVTPALRLLVIEGVAPVSLTTARSTSPPGLLTLIRCIVTLETILSRVRLPILLERCLSLELLEGSVGKVIWTRLGNLVAIQSPQAGKLVGWHILHLLGKSVWHMGKGLMVWLALAWLTEHKFAEMLTLELARILERKLADVL